MRAQRAAAFAALLLAAPALALVSPPPENARTERPAADDPGWNNIGRVHSTSAVYLGDGWILTARHAGISDVKFGKRTYPPVPESAVQLQTPEMGQPADLVVYRLDPAPDLPPIRITRKPVSADEEVVMIGFGFGLGEGAVDASGRSFPSDGQSIKRWGTNRVEEGTRWVPGPGHAVTRCFSLEFVPGETRHESQATVGDSGGAVFRRTPKGAWRLAGIMLSVNYEPGQPLGEVRAGNITNAADLAHYLPQIEAVRSGAAPELP